MLKWPTRPPSPSIPSPPPNIESNKPQNYPQDQRKTAFEKILNPGPFLCSKCPRSFKRLHNLKVHALSHDENSPSKSYSCDVCNGTFTRNYDLIRHRKIHLQTTEELSKYKCEICESVFKRKDIYTRHKKSFCSNKAPLITKITHSTIATSTLSLTTTTPSLPIPTEPLVPTLSEKNFENNHRNLNFISDQQQQNRPIFPTPPNQTPTPPKTYQDDFYLPYFPNNQTIFNQTSPFHHLNLNNNIMTTPQNHHLIPPSSSSLLLDRQYSNEMFSANVGIVSTSTNFLGEYTGIGFASGGGVVGGNSFFNNFRVPELSPESLSWYLQALIDRNHDLEADLKRLEGVAGVRRAG